MARDPLMGVGPHDPPMRAGLSQGEGVSGFPASRIVFIGIILAGVLIGMGMFIKFDKAPPVATTGNQDAPVAAPTPVATEALPPPPPLPNAAPVPAADFAVTGALIGKKLSVEQVRTAGVKSLCLGAPLAIRNDTAATVTLLDTPENSDATIELAKVKPGTVLRFTPNEAGPYFVRDRASGSWLFAYKVDECGSDGGNAPGGQ